MPLIDSLKQWVAREKLKAADLNGQLDKIFQAVNNWALFADINKGVSAVYTFSAQQVFQGGARFEAPLLVTVGGMQVAGGAQFSGDVQFSNSVDITQNLAVHGNAEVSGSLLAGANLSAGVAIAAPVGTFASSVTAPVFNGSAASMTGYKVTNLVMDGVIPAGNGSLLTGLNGSQVTSGEIANNRIANFLSNKTFRQASVGFGSGPELGCLLVASEFQYVAANAVPTMVGPVGTTWVWMKIQLDGQGFPSYVPVLTQ